MDDQQDLSWLIRDSSNKIRGPFKQSEIVQLIRKGQLKGKTEVSRANSYWFAIEEKTELGRFLPEFNGGRPPPEAPTQMTATLTEADLQDHGIEVTTFTSVPKAEQNGPKDDHSQLAEGIASGNDQMEWLSEELAEEFGADMGVTISVQTDVSALNPQPAESAPLQEPSVRELPEEKTPLPTVDEKARQEMLKRATVKADALPSELRSFQGERPKPINTLMRNPGDKHSAHGHSHPSALVNVPVEPEPAPKMFSEDEEIRAQAARRKLILQGLMVLGVLLLVGLTVNFVMGLKPAKNAKTRVSRGGEEAVAAARQAIILSDLEGAKDVLADLDAQPGSKAEASVFLAQAVVKKEFYSDVEGAILALQSAKSMVKSKKTEAEVDNLLAVYTFERDPPSGSEMLRRNLETHTQDAIFRYNLALSLVRSGHPQDAIPILDSLLKDLPQENPLSEDAAIALGRALDSHCSVNANAREPVCRRNEDAEAAYARALDTNPQSAKARLGLALYRLKPTRGGIKSAESDFRSFLDAAPELEPKARIKNYRKLGNDDFYGWAHEQIGALNTAGQSMSKPSPLVMAADALIQSMLHHPEARSILAAALQSAPGDVHLLKAQAYIYWTESKFNEVIEALKEIKDRSSFAVNYMVGKAHLKLHKREAATVYAKNLLDTFPNRSEGHALMGEILLETPDKLEEAKAAFHLALKRDPLDLIAWRGLQKTNEPIILSPDIQKNLPF